MESSLCDYPLVVDYILEINLTKRKKDFRMVLFTFNVPTCCILSKLMSERQKAGVIFCSVSNNEKDPLFSQRL